jgi:hypothetical protein
LQPVARRSPSKRSSAVPSEEVALLRRLEESLSDEEIQRVLACALLLLDDAARERLFARVGPETAAALGPVLALPPKSARSPKPGTPVTSKGKLRQEWDKLWEEWAAVIDESGDEEGKYVIQDHHWEQPYLDPSSISTDLEAIAARMRALIPRVIAEGIAPELSFAEAVEEMNEGLYAGLPDWIEPGGDEACCLGPEATACLLEWEWASAQREGRDAAAFLDDVRDLETRLDNVELDHKAITTFVLGLPDQQLRGVLASMLRQRSSKRWADAFTRAHGCWAEILRALSQRWNPALHAEISRANIAQDWTLALPLVKDAVKRKAFAEAATLIDAALRSRLQLDQAARWEPREELLVQREHRYYGDEGSAKLATLLRCWQETARAQGQLDLAAALALQIIALREVEHGEVMLEAFRAVPPQFHAMHEALFANWRTLIVQRTLHTWGSGARVACGDWVAALVDAARAGSEGAAPFHAAVRAALEEAHAASEPRPKPPSQRWRVVERGATPLFALSILTRDLDAAAPTLKKSASKLWKLLGAEEAGERDRVAATRRAWCKRLGGASLVPEILAFWRDHATLFVPDPGDTTGDYAQSADWLAAVHDLNPAAAKELLVRWASTHRLKRNLWRDLAQRDLPMPADVRAPGSEQRR